jgi:hypothetical protein
MTLTEAETIIALQQSTINYMRSIVKRYVDNYNMIETALISTDPDQRDSVLNSMDDIVVNCHASLQPVLTLWEDTKPENVKNTLAGKTFSQYSAVSHLLN